jgi:nitroreductase
MFKKIMFSLGVLMMGTLNCMAVEVQQLPTPDKSSELMQLIDARQSARVYSSKPVSEQTLSEVLWAAFGVNKKGTRTIPTARNEQNLKVFVIYKNSIWQYDGEANALVKVSDEDVMNAIALQDFVKNAPVNLIYTGSDEKYSAFHAGSAAQNVSLYATQKGLNSVVRGYIDKGELKDKLHLESDEFVIMNQVIGYPES